MTGGDWVNDVYASPAEMARVNEIARLLAGQKPELEPQPEPVVVVTVTVERRAA